MATPVANETQVELQKTMRLIVQLINEKAHGRITITLRDGKIQLLNVERAYLPKNLP